MIHLDDYHSVQDHTDVSAVLPSYKVDSYGSGVKTIDPDCCWVVLRQGMHIQVQSSVSKVRALLTDEPVVVAQSQNAFYVLDGVMLCSGCGARAGHKHAAHCPMLAEEGHPRANDVD